MSDTPPITVVTATRNRTDLLERALRSVAAQTVPDLEVVVVDDGSDADVHPFYDALFASLPTGFRRHPNRPPGSAGAGPGAARNAGLRVARGEFVAFLDDDDFWTRPDHLSVALDALRRTGADFYFANMRGVRGDQVPVPDWYAGAKELTAGRVVNNAPRVYDVPAKSFFRVMRHHLAHPDVWVVRRKLVEEVGGFWDKVRFGEDWELQVRIAERANQILYRPEVVCDYRLPEGNSVSLTLTRLEEHIQRISCSIHARTNCATPAARRCARSREAWHYREIARDELAARRPSVACSFAWQAVCLYPTLGAAAFLARCAVRTVI